MNGKAALLGVFNNTFSTYRQSSLDAHSMTKSERFTESLYETMITTAFARIVDKHEVTLASTLNRLTSAYMSLDKQARDTEKAIAEAKQAAQKPKPTSQVKPSPLRQHKQVVETHVNESAGGGESTPMELVLNQYAGVIDPSEISDNPATLHKPTVLSMAQHFGKGLFYDTPRDFISGLGTIGHGLGFLAQHPLQSMQNISEFGHNASVAIDELLYQGHFLESTYAGGVALSNYFSHLSGDEWAEGIGHVLGDIVTPGAAMKLGRGGIAAAGRIAPKASVVANRFSTFSKNAVRLAEDADAVMINADHAVAEAPLDLRVGEASGPNPGGGVLNSSRLRAYVEVNIAQTRKGIDSSNFLAYIARYNQLEIGYGSDVWQMGYLREGDLVYGGLPGPSSYYTNLETVLASGGVNAVLFRSLQVKPDPLRGYRPELGVYKINKDIRIPMGTVKANPMLGPGGGQQFLINNYSNRVSLVERLHIDEFYAREMQSYSVRP